MRSPFQKSHGQQKSMVQGSIATERVFDRTITICIAGEVLKESLIILRDGIIAVVIMIRSLTYDGIIDPARISRDIDDKVRC